MPSQAMAEALCFGVKLLQALKQPHSSIYKDISARKLPALKVLP